MCIQASAWVRVRVFVCVCKCDVGNRIVSVYPHPHPPILHCKLLALYIVCGFVVINDLEWLHGRNVIDDVAV